MLITVHADRYTAADPGDDTQINNPSVSTDVVAATVTGAGISESSTSTSNSPASSPAASTTGGSSSPGKPGNITLYIVIGAGIGAAGLIGVVILTYRRRRRRQPAGPEESAPFMATSSRPSTTGGIFTNASNTDASHGHFSDVQGDQSNMRIHTINYNYWRDASS